MTKRVAACEISTTLPSCRAFVGVHPPHPESRDERNWKWTIKKFTISESLINEWFGQEDLIGLETVRVDTIEEVETVLSSWGIDSSCFDAPWKVNYPL